MKCLTLVLVLLAMLASLFVTSSEASYCPCDLSQKGEICGSNGVTYKNRCEFDCTQREYRKLGRTLNFKSSGSCPKA
ncbi:uncharacterized protein Dana_GF21605 [Drosophila ananassae]|uniref:Kazal-like domain-containing protein n=1 Tax=Drosophila ananassae TaxID=7217 RepID=B3MVF0_DROAN|nr:uncharacterized protein LOC6504280 [Drosophila ananassae]EDV33215.1 uncharacterized protein Dana_GF21605 [Drosophila ananassae]